MAHLAPNSFSSRQNLVVTSTTSTQSTTAGAVSSGVGILYAAQLIADLAFAASLVILVYQIYLQRKDTRIAAYDKLMGDFTQIQLEVMEHPEVTDYLYGKDGHSAGSHHYEKEETIALHYMDALIGLIERVWIAQRQYKFPGSNWIQWRYWLVQLGKSPHFREYFESARGYYDSSFVNEVQKAINESKAEGKS